ncbi:hypothetical protein BGZ57DRAFT_580858 [Hyaloscypha finlandica]|nr:hypothetical protein BGZ57DRAFT_580858 [Hyaloscypha finlandica]KAH8786352.1 hypothetical protein F5882DRAFT_123224 [Hyaloscypha sp. PMI_1271]
MPPKSLRLVLPVDWLLGTTDMHCRESRPAWNLGWLLGSPNVGYEAISFVFSKKVKLSVVVIAHVGLLSTRTGEVPHWATALLSPSAGWAVCAVTAASPYRVERAHCFLSRIASLASFICSSLISTPTYSRRSVADRRPAGRWGCCEVCAGGAGMSRHPCRKTTERADPTTVPHLERPPLSHRWQNRKGAPTSTYITSQDLTEICHILHSAARGLGKG